MRKVLAWPWGRKCEQETWFLIVNSQFSGKNCSLNEKGFWVKVVWESLPAIWVPSGVAGAGVGGGGSQNIH